MPRETRIPRPPAKAGPLQGLRDNVRAKQSALCPSCSYPVMLTTGAEPCLPRMQDLNKGKKRGATTPLAGKVAKRAAQVCTCVVLRCSLQQAASRWFAVGKPVRLQLSTHC